MASVSLAKVGGMRDASGSRFSRFRAEQTIAVDRTAFTWRARTGPFGLISVTDRLAEGEGAIRVRALRVIPLGGAGGGAALTKGELMRYLAELPWAPDALPRNRALEWRVMDRGTLTVRVRAPDAETEVELALNGDGVVHAASAPRPRAEGGGFVDRPWRGRFSDYRWHDGRYVPFRASAAWLLDGREVEVWRGELTHWRLR